MFFVYIMASRRDGTIYTGSTDDLAARVQQHKARRLGGFTARYDVDKLVWFETHPTRDQAFRRERQINLDRLLMEEEVRALRDALPGSRRSPG
jgi:putative endonuclease